MDGAGEVEGEARTRTLRLGSFCATAPLRHWQRLHEVAWELTKTIGKVTVMVVLRA